MMIIVAHRRPADLKCTKTIFQKRNIVILVFILNRTRLVNDNIIMWFIVETPGDIIPFGKTMLLKTRTRVHYYLPIIIYS